MDKQSVRNKVVVGVEQVQRAANVAGELPLVYRHPLLLLASAIVELSEALLEAMDVADEVVYIGKN